jgi:lactoylglutathione lyase
MSEHSHLGFTKLLVNQLEPAADFYKSVCGLVEVARIEDELAGRKISEIMFAPTKEGSATFILLSFEDSESPASQEVINGFNTPDLAAFITRALEGGGQVVDQPKDYPDYKCRVAIVKDNEGHLIEVVQPLL